MVVDYGLIQGYIEQWFWEVHLDFPFKHNLLFLLPRAADLGKWVVGQCHLHL